MRGRTNPHDVEYEPWDPANQGPFRAIAGRRFRGTKGGSALFQPVTGPEISVPPGWVVMRLESGEPFVTSPEHLGGPEATFSAVA